MTPTKDALPINIRLGAPGAVVREYETCYLLGVSGQLDRDDLDELISKLQTMAMEIDLYRQEKLHAAEG